MINETKEEVMDEKEKQIYIDMQHIVKKQDEKSFEIMQMRVMLVIMFFISVFQSAFFLKMFF